MDIKNILAGVVADHASDVFIVAGLPLSMKTDGTLRRCGDEQLTSAMTRELVSQIYAIAGERDMSKLLDSGDDDFAFAIPGLSRFRASVYKQRGSLSAVIRVITFVLPQPDSLNIPECVMELSERPKGLILVTGPSGSGKSTTLACMIDRINTRCSEHIITLEDPIEYLHPHKKSIVSQREISLDTLDYLTALRAALRQVPDVILIGELRDTQTVSVAMTAAETGHLVISTLHTLGAANTIDRIIDSFPAHQQAQIRLQLSMVLQAVVSQQLVPSLSGRLLPAFEIMIANTAVRNIIRESKTHQIESVIYSGAAQGMVSMDNSLLSLYNAGAISAETALSYSFSPESLAKRINN